MWKKVNFTSTFTQCGLSQQEKPLKVSKILTVVYCCCLHPTPTPISLHMILAGFLGNFISKGLKTNQLVVNTDEKTLKPIARLKEPRDLFALPKDKDNDCSQQAPRWPVECQVSTNPIYPSYCNSFNSSSSRSSRNESHTFPMYHRHPNRSMCRRATNWNRVQLARRMASLCLPIVP